MTQRVIEALEAAGFTKNVGSHWRLDLRNETVTCYYDGERYHLQHDKVGSHYENSYGEATLIMALEFCKVLNRVYAA